MSWRAALTRVMATAALVATPGIAPAIAPAQVIVIEPAQPTVVHGPVYNPTLVYGPWWYPAYPPYYYPPPGRAPMRRAAPAIT